MKPRPKKRKARLAWAESVIAAKWPGAIRRRKFKAGKWKPCDDRDAGGPCD